MSSRNANIHGLRARGALKTARRWLLCLEMLLASYPLRDKAAVF